MATSEVVSFDYNHGEENGDTDQDNEMEDSPDEEQNISDPKLFKATLCQFYLKGPCKNGDNCTYAHGTSELRTSQGGSIADIESNDKKVLFKTTLCAKFVTYGDCPFGPSCNFAHGVKELRQSLEAASISKEEGDKAKQNPSYKTSLCKNYMMGMYCQFADKCQYAHGRHELRDKPPAVPPSQLPDDVKKRLAEKAKSLPGYKTKICNNFEKEGHCQYDDMCHYAHGEDELKEESEGDKMMAEKLKIRKNPFYKTIMCKSLATCQFGENCVYAHSEDEIRPVASNMMQGASFASKASSVGGGSMQGSNVMSGGYKTSLCKNYMDSGICSFGTKCTFAHGPMELRSSPGNMMPPVGPNPAMMQSGPMMGGGSRQPNPKYKTSMCTSVSNNVACTRGPLCHFAHSSSELRHAGTGPHAGAGGGGAGPTFMVQGSDGKIKYKTSMCTVFMEQGFCTRGENCAFAHSAKQLMEAQARDPKYKTMLCEAWKNQGTCDRGNNCIYAHGQNELRPKSSVSTPYSNAGANSNGLSSSTMAGHPRYKTSMCIAFAKNGFCDKSSECQYAHGPQDLRPMVGGGSFGPSHPGMMGHNGIRPSGMGVPPAGAGGHMVGNNYKTAMCKNMTDQGFCQHGDSCVFAHSSSELRAKNNFGGNGNNMMMDGGGPFNMAKRKRDNTKTVLCQNYSTYGECQFGGNCNFAHGPEELALSKKQRF